jgi:thiol-disulfide isomerase/thioredoxin
MAAAGLASIGTLARAAGVLSEWKGQPAAPPVELFTPAGLPFSLAALRGKVALVTFWATWCEPCVTEMPSLQALRDRLAPRFEVLGVNYQEGPEKINAFIEAMDIRFPIVRDTDGAVTKAWGTRIFPSSYVVDRDGHVKYTLVGGADWTSDKLVATISALL